MSDTTRHVCNVEDHPHQRHNDTTIQPSPLSCTSRAIADFRSQAGQRALSARRAAALRREDAFGLCVRAMPLRARRVPVRDSATEESRGRPL